jgi:uncharacterized damage-inducible protein DinB
MRPEPDTSGPDRLLLRQFLDLLRATVLWKTEGLDRAQMARQLPPSSLTLAGIVYHLALVEESWFEERFAGAAAREPWSGVDWDADPDWEFRAAAELDPDEVRARYRAAIERSNAVYDAAESLDRLSAKPKRDGRHVDLRWIAIHMIEETARHAGHADLLREAIDGMTGE